MSQKTPKIQLTTTFMLGILAGSVLASLLLAVFWLGSEYRQFQTMSKEMEADYIDSQKDLLKSEVARVIDYLEHEKAQAEGHLKADIKLQVNEAFALAEGIYRRHSDNTPVNEIQSKVIETLRDMRFDDGRGYFFATDLDGNARLFVDKPELEGHNLLATQDTNGQYVIRDMIALARTEGEGFYRYHWTKPNATGSGHAKIAYIKYFEPFNWYIGTGEYLEDIENDIKAEVIDRIEQIRFGTDGYIFVGTYDGLSLSGPVTNRNMWDVQDENGVKIVQELIAWARSGGGFVEYVMPKFEGLPSAPKLSYADQFADWQWYIGAGIYIDEINTVLNGKRAELWQHIRQHLIMIALTLAGVVVLTVIAGNTFTQRLRRNIQSFTQFFERASSEATKIDPAHVHFREFDHLAESANRMVDERHKADQALKESLEWNQTIFSAIQSGIVVIDAEAHRVVDVNPAAVEMIGLPRETIIGRPCHNFICPSQKGQCPILDLNQAVDHEERLLVKPDGTEIPILKTVSRIDVGGHPYLIEGFLDIAKQKKLETQLQQAQKMEAIGTLTGGIAHDFNNILGIILGNTELAQSLMTASDEAYANLEMTKEATLRAKKIVHQLLSYSRQTKADKTAVNINRLAEEAIGFIKALTPVSITIQHQITDRPCVIEGNATQIHQVLINLCVNASHAVDDETGIIGINVSQVTVDRGEFDHFSDIGGGTYAELTVSDNGHGIVPEIKDRIFDPYFTTKDVGKGTGMGLAVVMGIVKDHGGAIAIASEPEQGTTVRVVLPLTDHDPEAFRRPESQGYPSGNAETILFIDDEEMLVKLAQDLLKRLNYVVEGYLDATEAMERFRADPEAFDLVISDMTMPKMSGSRVIKEVRRIRPDIPVIICSGYSDNMDETRAGALGCQYIPKPIGIKILSEAVQKALTNR